MVGQSRVQAPTSPVSAPGLWGTADQRDRLDGTKSLPNSPSHVAVMTVPAYPNTPPLALLGLVYALLLYPPPLVLPHLLSFPRGGVGTVTCSTHNFSLQLTVLLWQNHHPRVLPKAFQWKAVSMCKSSGSSGAGPRKFTLSWSRSRSPYIGSPLNVSYAEFFRFMLQFLCLQMCVYGGSAVPQGGGGGPSSLGWGRTRGGGDFFASKAQK